MELSYESKTSIRSETEATRRNVIEGKGGSKKKGKQRRRVTDTVCFINKIRL